MESDVFNLSNTKHLRRNAHLCIRTSSPALRQCCVKSATSQYLEAWLSSLLATRLVTDLCRVHQKVRIYGKVVSGLGHVNFFGIFTASCLLNSFMTLQFRNPRNKIHGKPQKRLDRYLSITNLLFKKKPLLNFHNKTKRTPQWRSCLLLKWHGYDESVCPTQCGAGQCGLKCYPT
jgi:hypothetical protein